MSNTYVIQWKSKVNGRAGKGTRPFSREEAERLAEELNSEYPDIHHEVVGHDEPTRREPQAALETQLDEEPFSAPPALPLNA